MFQSPSVAAPARTQATASPDLPSWAAPLFSSEIAPLSTSADGDVLTWGIRNDASKATISDQFRANAGDYHERYAASDHFEALFRQALAATGVEPPPQPLLLDLGSGSGVNSVVPCRRLFPGVRAIATDLSGELLEILADYMRGQGAGDEVVCVVMDAMSTHVAPGQFDLVTGASILHHLERPEQGVKAAARALKPGGHAIFFEPFVGWALVRLAYERILAEAELRGETLEPVIETTLRGVIRDIATRSHPSPATQPGFAEMDDKWLFSRPHIELYAERAGFSDVRFVPHNDHSTLYRDAAIVQMRLTTGRWDLTLPDWANAVLDSFDAALPLQAKRELMLEGTIVLTKGR